MREKKLFEHRELLSTMAAPNCKKFYTLSVFVNMIAIERMQLSRYF